MIGKITYIVPLELSGNSYQGVLSKVRQQVRCWRDKGCEVQVIFISSSMPEVEFYEGEICLANNKISPKFINVYFWRIVSTFNILDLINCFKPDIIYTRYVLYWPFSNLIYRRFKSVAEMNTDDISEKRTLGFFLPVYIFFRKLFLKSKSGFCCVSADIEKTLVGQKTQVIPNGYDFSKVKFKPKKCRGNNVIFMSSPMQYWQGIDKIILLARKLPDYNFFIVGWESSDVGDNHASVTNLKFLGYQSGKELDALLSNADYAIGPLALHRKKMNTTSALKTSHYLSYNLPVIQCYEEVGLALNSILVIDNVEHNISDINVEKMSDFFEYWRFMDIDIDEVKSLVDITVTESKRLHFFESFFYGK